MFVNMVNFYSYTNWFISVFISEK